MFTVDVKQQYNNNNDVVECLTVDRRVPGSILGWGMKDFLRVRDMNNEFLYPRFKKVRRYTGLPMSVVPFIRPSFCLSVYFFFIIRPYITSATEGV